MRNLQLVKNQLEFIKTNVTKDPFGLLANVLGREINIALIKDLIHN